MCPVNAFGEEVTKNPRHPRWPYPRETTRLLDDAILQHSRHMQTSKIYLAVVVSKDYDPGPFWIYGRVIGRGNQILATIAGSNRKRDEWGTVQ